MYNSTLQRLMLVAMRQIMHHNTSQISSHTVVLQTIYMTSQ